MNSLQAEETPEERKIRLRRQAIARSRKRKRERQALSNKARLGI